MNLAALRALLDRNEHDAALGAVGRIRYKMLEGQLAKARADADDARRRLHDYQLDEREEVARLRLEVRKLQAQLHALQQQAMILAKYQPLTGAPARAEPAPVAPRKPPRRLSLIANSPLVQRAQRGEPYPEPPEPGTFDPTIEEEEARDYGSR